MVQPQAMSQISASQGPRARIRPILEDRTRRVMQQARSIAAHAVEILVARDRAIGLSGQERARRCLQDLEGSPS